MVRASSVGGHRHGQRVLFRVLAASVAGMLLAGCGGKAARVDVDSDDGAMLGGINSKDFRTVSSQMCQSLIQLPAIQNAESPPRVAFLEVVNNSDELLDTNDFLYKMRTELVKNAQGKLQFLDRDALQKILDERTLKQGGVVTGSTDRKVLGADYFLAGRVESIRRARGRESTQYLRFAFRLTDASSSAIVWEDDYEMKTYHKTGVYDR